jgi:hypothetical protein
MRTFVAIAALLLTLQGARAQNVPLLLFGGEGHKTFVGCLNCGKYDSGSVCNKYGEFGSKYNSGSIWNKYGDFGSKYSATSPWNRYAAEPPVIVDKEGNFYGYLTANKHNPKRTTIKALVALTDRWEEVTDDPGAMAEKFCQST